MPKTSDSYDEAVNAMVALEDAIKAAFDSVTKAYIDLGFSTDDAMVEAKKALTRKVKTITIMGNNLI